MTTLPTELTTHRGLVLTPRSGRRARVGEQWLAVAGDLVPALLCLAWTGARMAPGIIVAMLVWGAKGLYSRRFSLSVLDDLGSLVAGGVLGVLALLMLSDHPAHAVRAMAAFVLGVVVVRSMGYALLRHLRANGTVVYPAVIVGAGTNSVSLAQRIIDHPESGLRPVGFVDTASQQELPLPSLGSPESLPAVIREHHVTDVIVAYGKLPTASLVSVLRTCNRMGVEISMVPRLFEMHRLTPGGDHVWGHPLVHMSRHASAAWTWRVKRCLDVLASGLALILLLPVVGLVALAVRIELGRGVIFRQERVGLDGQPITVLKFRSMRPVPPGGEAAWTAASDPRVGRTGAFIRRFSLDEIPQLVNVLRGDMSLVGPRPERPEYVLAFSERYPRYGDRHRVPAGLTGLAAVEGLRGDCSIEDRAFFDNLYIENWSLWLDTKILVRTLQSVVRGTGT